MIEISRYQISLRGDIDGINLNGRPFDSSTKMVAWWLRRGEERNRIELKLVDVGNWQICWLGRRENRKGTKSV